ncbi:hypothetical protein MJ_0359 [Methanocaldococcus jannaschii DSM 2661]|uniref:Uncharacterized protein MJ0359 n=1 Tax=Methanocaldococcus jannaschii (strain ATCC 43067 / DSM 2661 / JAL-1 / JCM 10045 / NBRC 100440) TaxID=243232 RepID=Y359_METJA|nr:hypothetical protein [Methanocaldococcus jannaschii]Q57805.1 RecName: Full=Uncharacterized protein MJ0359 [Methanocaldococcus jannaschii DSM 2661]AAB98351.1 hypothetical protein MJ_0359 [Methanocaldococcus jannaschii DSM 2661]
MMSYVRMTLYHGTDRKSAEKIMESKEILPSQGDNHWLGDGIYFYEEEFHAFKWIWYKEKNRNRLLKNFAIIKAEVICEESRIFDLTKIEHKLLFDMMYKLINTTKLRLDKLRGDMCAEGVVINYMFKNKELGYNKRFDIVRALFPIPVKKYQKIENREKNKKYKERTHRLTFMPEIQVCVKNPSVIKKLEWYDLEKTIDKFLIYTEIYKEDLGI